MNPALFHVDWLGRTWVVTAYSASFTVAALALVAVSLLVAALRGGRPLARAVAVCLIVGIPAALVGARLLYWASNRGVYANRPQRLVSLGLGDFSMFGGLALAAVVVLAACLLLRTSAWSVADAMTPGTAMAIALLKLGCFFNGCCFGTRCDHPWGITFPSGSPAHLEQIRESGGAAIVLGSRPVHAVQLYEGAAAVTIAAVALLMLVRRAPAGSTFLIAAIAYAAVRLLVHQIRPNSATLTAPPWIYVAAYALLMAMCVMCWSLRASGRRDPSLSLTA